MGAIAGCLKQRNDFVAEKMLSLMHHRSVVKRVHHYTGFGEVGAGASNKNILNDRMAVTSDGDLAVVLDGNVYKWPTGNDPGEPGKGDAERLLLLYLRYGEDIAKHIDGAYAIAILDGQKKKLLLIRDRLGVQPLHYRNEKENFSFSSELKGLFPASNARPEIDVGTVDRFLALGYIPGPSTLFRKIRQVRPGHVLSVDSNGRTSERMYWEFRYKNPVVKLKEDEAVQEFKELLRIAAARRNAKHSEAPTLLSGGLDTAAVAAFLNEIRGGGFKALTAGFHEKEYNEIPDAKIVADYLDLEHRSILIDFDENFPDLLERLVWHHDAPFADTSAVPSYYVARLARDVGDTVFTGDFPDQLLGGSGHHARAIGKSRFIPAFLDNVRSISTEPIARRITASACGQSLGNKIKRAVYRECFPIHMQRVLMDMPVPMTLLGCLYSNDFIDALSEYDRLSDVEKCFLEVKHETLLNKILFFDMQMYAPDDLMVKVDRMCAAHGLEAVSPFHDNDIVEFAAALPPDMKIRNGQRKYILRETLRSMLPAHTLNKRKQGFAMPIGRWLTNRLSDWVKSVLTDQRTLQRGYFDARYLRRLVMDYFAGRTDYASGSEATIISLITLELWHRCFIDKDISGF